MPRARRSRSTRQDAELLSEDVLAFRPLPGGRDDWLKVFQQDFENGDLVAVLLAMGEVTRRGLTLPTWLHRALRTCVLECLERRPSSKTRSQLTKLRARREDYKRFDIFVSLLDDGFSKNKAYQRTANERARETGIHVSAGAIRQSVSRVLAAARHRGYLYEEGPFEVAVDPTESGGM